MGPTKLTFDDFPERIPGNKRNTCVTFSKYPTGTNARKGFNWTRRENTNGGGNEETERRGEGRRRISGKEISSSAEFGSKGKRGQRRDREKTRRAESSFAVAERGRMDLL
jgi:hypothetical protein